MSKIIFTPEILKQVEILAEEGKNQLEMAETLGMGRTKFIYHLNRNDALYQAIKKGQEKNPKIPKNRLLKDRADGNSQKLEAAEPPPAPTADVEEKIVTYSEVEKKLLAAIDARYVLINQMKKHAGIPKSEDITEVIEGMLLERKIVRFESMGYVGYCRPKRVPKRFWSDGTGRCACEFAREENEKPAVAKSPETATEEKIVQVVVKTADEKILEALSFGPMISEEVLKQTELDGVFDFTVGKLMASKKIEGKWRQGSFYLSLPGQMPEDKSAVDEKLEVLQQPEEPAAVYENIKFGADSGRVDGDEEHVKTISLEKPGQTLAELINHFQKQIFDQNYLHAKNLSTAAVKLNIELHLNLFESSPAERQLVCKLVDAVQEFEILLKTKEVAVNVN